MNKIVVVDSKNKQLINNIANLHLRTFKGFFLSFLGLNFLKLMYKSYCEFSDAQLIASISTETGELQGFLAYSSNTSSLYKYMIKKRLFSFMFASIRAFITKPKIFTRLVRAFLKPSEMKRTDEYVEISSIGVDPKFQREHIGTSLINYVKSVVDYNKFEYISLETDALNNDHVNKFYVKNGFYLSREYLTHEGRKMNEYRYKKN